jgi:hypothetical protein
MMLRHIFAAGHDVDKIGAHRAGASKRRLGTTMGRIERGWIWVSIYAKRPIKATRALLDFLDAAQPPRARPCDAKEM